jgi:hypothetical protein
MSPAPACRASTTTHAIHGTACRMASPDPVQRACCAAARPGQTLAGHNRLDAWVLATPTTRFADVMSVEEEMHRGPFPFWPSAFTPSVARTASRSRC